MNCFFVSGRIFTEPTSSFIQFDDKEVLLAKFCISSSSDFMYLNIKDDEQTSHYNFYQCVAFGDVAKQIVELFDRGIKVSMQALVENFSFKDSNGTPHFTNILLVNQIEYDSNASQSFKVAPRKKNMDKVMVSELKTIDQLFKEVCDKGFLCINETDYYNMTIKNMVYD